MQLICQSIRFNFQPSDALSMPESFEERFVGVGDVEKIIENGESPRPHYMVYYKNGNLEKIYSVYQAWFVEPKVESNIHPAFTDIVNTIGG